VTEHIGKTDDPETQSISSRRTSSRSAKAGGSAAKSTPAKRTSSGSAKPARKTAGKPVDAEFTKPSLDSLTRFCIVGLFIIAFVASLSAAQAFFMPVVLAFLFALTFSPVVRFFVRVGIPAPLTALGIVLCLFMTVAIGGYMLSAPLAGWIDRVPQLSAQISARLAELDLPLDRLRDMSRNMEQATQGEPEPGMQRVVVQTSSFLEMLAAGLASAGTVVAVTMVLLFFLLASGTLFYEKLVQSFSSMREKKKALTIVYSVERDVSGYLFTISLINAGLGLAIGGAMYLLGMPNPVLWGVAAAVLNFIPYLGALIGLALASLVSLITFDTLGEIVVVPIVYLMLTSIEGQIVTPLFVGRRLEINAVFVFLCVGFWAWLWGIVGALIAVPVLVVIKTIADHAEGHNTLAHFLSASTASPKADADEAAASEKAT
jgi:predicted PurR-regulated permease PerM